MKESRRTTSPPASREKQMALARSYAKKTLCQCDQACPSMDTSGKKEQTKAENNMEKIN